MNLQEQHRIRIRMKEVEQVAAAATSAAADVLRKLDGIVERVAALEAGAASKPRQRRER